jgi:hypothetical protein
MVDEMGGDLPALPNPIKQKPIYLFIYLSLFLKRRKSRAEQQKGSQQEPLSLYNDLGKKGAAAAAPCTHTDTGAQANQHTSSIDLRVEIDLSSFPL